MTLTIRDLAFLAPKSDSVPLRPDVESWLANATGTYSGAEQIALNSFMQTLDDAGILPDVLWLYQFAKNEHDANFDVCQLWESFTISSPTFTQGEGYVPGSIGYIDTGFTPVDGVKYQVNSASIWAWSRTEPSLAVTTPAIIGSRVSSSSRQSILLRIGTGIQARMNQNSGTGANLLIADVGLKGLLGSIRTDSSEAVIRVNGSSAVVSAASDPTLSSVSFYVMNRNENYTAYNSNFRWTGQVSMVAIGGGITAGQWTTLRTAVDTFHTAIGFVQP